MHVPDLTRRVDGLESGLPGPASRVLHAQRSAVSAAGGVARDAVEAISHVAGAVLGTARDGVTSVLARQHRPAPTSEPAPVRQPAPVPEPASVRTPPPIREVVEEDDLGTLSRGELLGRARELDIDGRTKMSKSQLVNAIRAAS